MNRREAIALVAAALPDGAAAVACNGMISRELHAARDRPSHFYMIGSMGLASSIGLGLALARPAHPVVIFDGDGNVLMNLGALANVAASQPANFYHVVFDNGVHGSTGGQRTVSERVPIERVAEAAGYRRAARATTVPQLSLALKGMWDAGGPALLLVQVSAVEPDAAPRVDIAPRQLAHRFRDAMR